MDLLQKAAVPIPMIFDLLGPTHISVATDQASGPQDMLNANTYTHCTAKHISTPNGIMINITHNKCYGRLAVFFWRNGWSNLRSAGESTNDEHRNYLDT